MLIEKENNDKYILFPLKKEYKEIWNAYKAAQASIWFAEDVDLQGDLKDWEDTEEKEKEFIKMILMFFSSIDSIVNENLVLRFYNDCSHLPFAAEAKCFYTAQAFSESVHAESYALLIDTYITDQEEKDKAFNAITKIPIIKKKSDFIKKWIQSDAPYAERLIAFAGIEGISFSSSFCAIFYERSKGKFPGLAMTNSYIVKDENLHAEFSVIMYKLCGEKVSKEKVYQIIDELVDLEIEFCKEALPVSFIGMNSDLMIQYVKFVADRMIQEIGFEKKYNTTNPFGFMELASLQNKTNFFEKRVVEYAKPTVGKTQQENNISFDADF